MIQLNDRIHAFVATGRILRDLRSSERQYIYEQARKENNWFTAHSIEEALNGVIHYLDEEKLKTWTKDLPDQQNQVKTIGTAMAGNIPLVGFHDFLSVLISGHKLKAKLSSNDSFLLKYIANILIELEPRFNEYIEFAGYLKNVDAIIATGSDNTARHFEYYFRNIPHIIRRNRVGVAVLDGNESENDLYNLGYDIFQYYGLGCRNIAHMLVPENFNFDHFINAINDFNYVMDHHKYYNNYDYNKSVFLVNQEPFWDGGHLILKEQNQLASPLAVVYYQHYSDKTEVENYLQHNKEKIQCIVSGSEWVPEAIPFGKAQLPELWDYADNVNTLEFLQSL